MADMWMWLWRLVEAGAVSVTTEPDYVARDFGERMVRYTAPAYSWPVALLAAVCAAVLVVMVFRWWDGVVSARGRCLPAAVATSGE